MKIGVIGTGYWGKNHVRTYHEMMMKGMIDSMVICDSNEAQAKELSRTYDIEYRTDYNVMLRDPDIDAVSIVTPSATHYNLAKEFMRAGKDVLVEKPMTLNSDEAKDLVNVADKTGCILMVGHIFRYHPAVIKLKHKIYSGELGDIKLMMSNRLDFGIPRTDMGVIHALGIHELDLYCYLMGVDFPKSITASITGVNGIEESALISMDFGNTKGYAHESWIMPTGKQRDIVVVGTEGHMKIDYITPPAEPLKAELIHFIDCVRTRNSPETNGMVGMRAVVMAEKALESARLGRRMIL